MNPTAYYRKARHIKRGTCYDIVAKIIASKSYEEGDIVALKIHSSFYVTYAEIQCSTRVKKYDTLVLYKGSDSKYWLREVNEFNDRFAPITEEL